VHPIGLYCTNISRYTVHETLNPSECYILDIFSIKFLPSS